MIEFLKTGDFAHVQLNVMIILTMWSFEVMAVLIDFWSGTNTARALGQKLDSGGFRRSFAKLGDYWRVTVMFLFIDITGSFFRWYSLPFATMLIAMGVVLTEGRSVYENARAKKSQIQKLPENIRAIIRCSDAKSASELLQKLTETLNPPQNKL